MALFHGRQNHNNYNHYAQKKLCIQSTFRALVQLFLSFHPPLSFSILSDLAGVVISGCSHNNNNNNTRLLTAFP